MDKQTILIEAPHHKTEDTFFTTIDGRIWLLFGCTDSVVLARLCYMVDGQIHFAPLSSIEYNQFDDWTEDTKSDNRLNLSGRTMDDTNGQTATRNNDNDTNGQTMNATQLTSYRKWRSAGYTALIAYRMAMGDINARLCGMIYSGKRDCQAYTNNSRYSGWIFFINV